MSLLTHSSSDSMGNDYKGYKKDLTLAQRIEKGQHIQKKKETRSPEEDNPEPDKSIIFIRL